MREETLTQRPPGAYVRWGPPGLPSITLRCHAVDGIFAEVLRGFNAVPKRGAETGGILLGRRTGNEVVVEDFEPVPCEHRFGPSYLLSDSDREALKETLHYFRTERAHGVSIVGFYRSHTRPEFSLSPEDTALFEEHFADPSQVFLLIKPGRLQQSVADFFFWRDGALCPGLHMTAFPFQEPAAPPARTPEPAHPAPEPAPVAPPPPAPAAARPTLPKPAPPKPAHPKREPLPVHFYEKPRSERPYWAWGTAAAVLAIVGGAFAYREMQAPPSPPPPAAAEQQAPAGEPPPVIQPPREPEPAAPPASTESAPPEAEAPKPAPHEAAPAEAEAPKPAPVPDSTAIRSLLERWSAAIRSGDVDAAARCYAPSLTNYLGRPGATQDDVRGHMKYLQGRTGKLVIHRIGEVGIAPTGSDLATVRFRRHWETAGPPRASGESKQEMTLVRTARGWKIAAEQETRVY